MQWKAKPEIVTLNGQPTGKRCPACGKVMGQEGMGQEIMGQGCSCVGRIFRDDYRRWRRLSKARRQKAIRLVEKYWR